MLLLIYSFSAVLALGAAPSYAQNCNVAPEVISKLVKPVIGAYNLWDTVYGEQHREERFKALDISKASTNVISVGEGYVSQGAPKTLLIAEIDRRGRPVWEKEHTLEGLLDVVGLMERDGGEGLILANVEGKNKMRSVWIGFHDKEGNIAHTAVITDKKYNIESTDFLMAHNGQLLVSVVKEPKTQDAPAATALYWIDLKTRKVARTVTFALGMENKINALARHGDKNYIGAGSVRSADGRISGWVILVNEKGGFNWQKPFPRGMGGRFYDAIEYNDQYVMAVGEAMPAGESNKRAAWVAMINAETGDIGWQRYYRDDHNLSAVAAQGQDDTQVSVLINAWGADNKEDLDFVRMLTMNARGFLLNSDSYNNGVGAQASGFTLGRNNERIIFGDTDVVHNIEGEMPQDGKQVPITDSIRTKEAWIVAGAPSEVYKDPCHQTIQFLE